MCYILYRKKFKKIKIKNVHTNTTLKARVYLDLIQAHAGKVYMHTQKLKTAADQYDASLGNVWNLNGCVVIGRCPVQVRKKKEPTGPTVW